MRQHLLAALCGLMATGPLPALQVHPDGRTITLSDDEAAACAAGGGCVLAPRAAIAIEAKALEERVKAATRAMCRSAT